MMKIAVDRTRCAGMGLREAIAPDFFEAGDDGVARMSPAAADADADVKTAEEAVLDCPTAALSIQEKNPDTPGVPTFGAPAGKRGLRWNG